MKYTFIAFLFVTAIAISKSDDFNLGIRNIKLGNTYREAGNYDFAARFINDGMKTVEKKRGFEAKYWTATGYEYLGYLYRDMNMLVEAKKNFERAVATFKEIIKQEDGSQYAMIDVINGLSRSISADGVIEGKSSESLSLNFSQSKLKALPDGIPINIKSLVLRNNKFTNFPEGLSKFNQLEYLDLSGNRIKSVPESISELSKLHYLDLSSNRVSSLPISLSDLNQLKELNLADNKLKNIPTELCNLNKLRLLNLKGNKLKFEEVLNLVRCLQNTNIIFDEYQKIDEEVSPGDD